MKGYLVLIPILILALFQGIFLPVNVVLLVVLTWAIVRPAQEVLLVAFLGGLFLDLIKGDPLGLNSLLLMSGGYLLILYSRRFDPAHPVFLSVFVFLVSVISNIVLGKPWLISGLVLAALSLLVRPLVKYYAGDFVRGEIKLKVN
jgi:rod shape-determining protein MreD